MSTSKSKYTPQDPAVVVNISKLVKLADAGIKISDYWKEMSALKVTAATRPLTLAEECVIDQAETMIEQFTGFLQTNANPRARISAPRS